MAHIPDLRTVDPSRPGIGAQTVAVPDIIEPIKAFNDEWKRFEDDLDTARLKELTSICKSGEMLWRCMRMRVQSVRLEMRADKMDAMQRKLEELQQKQAAAIAYTLKEESSLFANVKLSESEAWIQGRINRLQKRLKNRQSWTKRHGKQKQVNGRS